MLSRGRGARLVTVALTVALCACGGRGWVADHPDVAERARERPSAFVGPTLDRWRDASTLSGAYQLRAARGVGRRTFDLAVSVQRPDRVDISILDPTGAIQAYLRADPSEVGLYVAEDRVLYRGPATREAFERALGLELSAADAVAVFLGYGVAGESGGEAIWDEEARRVRVDVDPRTSFWLHPVDRVVDRVVHRSSGGTVAADLLEWMSVVPEADPEAAPLPVPSTSEIRVEPDGVTLTLRLLAEPRVGHELPAELFRLQAPAGTLELPLEELARQGGLFQRTEPEDPTAA